MTKAVNIAQSAAAGVSLGFKNRIINGAMVIDQRNAGASVTPTVDGSYNLDRWKVGLSQASKFSVQQNAGSVTPPVGFTNYLGATSLSAYSVGSGDTFLLQQNIEGFNVADLGFGTANAQTVTLSFWVRSSLTGTFGGSLLNSAANRSYPFSYTISSANTWEQKSITIAGDTTGTWLTTNGVGLCVRLGLGSGSTFSGTSGAWATGNIVQPTSTVSVVGTSGATFYITGVQLEVGTAATNFEYRDYGRELMMCQRYYFKMKGAGVDTAFFGAGFMASTTNALIVVPFQVPLRATPTAFETSGTASDYYANGAAGPITLSVAPAFADAENFSGRVSITVASGFVTGQSVLFRSKTVNGFIAWSAEL